MTASRGRFGAAGHNRGLLIALLALFHQTSSGSVTCKDAQHQRCREDAGGVRDFECFGRYSKGVKYFSCTWRPSGDPSGTTYELFQQQSTATETKCRHYKPIAGTSANITIFKKLNVSVEVLERNGSSVCSSASFRGSPSNMMRCGPPVAVSFRRRGGRMAMNVTWRPEDHAPIRHFAVRYQVQDGGLWSQMQSESVTAATVDAVNSSLAYAVQVSCVRNEECAQCPWGRRYHVPPELTMAPELVHLEDVDAGEPGGRRRLTLTWKFASESEGGSYWVTIGKASGEGPREVSETAQPRITFILSYSSYQLEIHAFNNASASPALRWPIRRRDDRLGPGAESTNVTVHSNRSFTISWRKDLTGNYICYTAEWTAPGRKAAYMSFHSNVSSRMLTFQRDLESLEPYTRYTLTLNLLPDKDSCNLKRINNSESTYGSTRFYFLEGSPDVAPANVSSHNVTLDSAVLRWSAIPEEDARGFMLGYIVYYSEYQQGTRVEENVTVNPDVNTHTLERLKSGTLYEVQVSGFTRAGVGVRSEPRAFTTDRLEFSSLSRVVKIAAIVTTVLILGSPIIQRAKRAVWPSIPNPKKSNMMQKLEMTNELELLQSISTLKVEEWDTDSLQIVEKQQTVAVSMGTPLLPGGSGEALGDPRETQLQPAPPAPAGEYTTMEMFLKAAPASTPVGPEAEPGVTAARSPLDYVRQFSTDSTWDSQ